MLWKIHIVEDHELVRESYIMLLELESDLEVAGVSASAEEALQRLVDAPPDLLLVDISLPGMSGIQLLEALREREALVPALVLTGHDKKQYRQQAEAAGARGFVRKQDGPDAILGAIRGVLGREGT